jgi:hypothetical protein
MVLCEEERPMTGEPGPIAFAPFDERLPARNP